ncbi:MAG: primosomal protein N' [Cyanobium sp.]
MDVWLEAGPEGRLFTYTNPGALGLSRGDLVRVRLQGRPHTGLVVAEHRSRPLGLEGKSVQPVEAVVQRAAIDPSWQSLIEDVAHCSHTSVFRCLRSALPPGWLGQRGSRAGAAAQPWIGIEITTSATTAARAGASERQRALLQHVLRLDGPRPLRHLCGADGFSRTVVEACLRHGWIRRCLITPEPPGARKEPVATRGRGGEPPHHLSPAQRQAVATITTSDPGVALLLWGVTGSGKTEVYMQCAAAELAAGRSVLLLAPEIGLIPQLIDRCRARFGSAVVEYHSGMGGAERVGVWRRALQAGSEGIPLLAIGTRSAVFLPLSALGLIVLDEEHDGSYKQESPQPCYHAREVARLRATREGAKLLLGSATPSLETWLRCRGPRADTSLLQLPERITERPPPPVRVVDMRLELSEGNRQLISRALQERLQRLPERGEQGVILVPRRGYRAFQSCRSCGSVVQCPHCDVALTVHRHREGQEWLRCHWCDHRQEAGHRCGACGSTAFKAFGAGTQRVMEQLEAELTGLRLIRFDADTTRGRDGHRRLLERFAAGDADVLVGTQMLAKGMDLPKVTLAAVLAADGLLHRPDLRSSETCLQLLLQLAGRAGRGERPGEVLVQTYSPSHPVIDHLVDGRYGAFLEAEAAQRQAGGLVPFSRACLLRLAGSSSSATATAAASLAALLRMTIEAAGWCLIGPAPAPVARVAGRSRWQILLHGPAGSSLPLPVSGHLREALPRGVSLTIDPDPLEL